MFIPSALDADIVLTNLNPSHGVENRAGLTTNDLFGKRRTRMAKVEWSAGIDHVSGALSKPGKNPQHSCNKMLLGTHRTAATTNPNCNRLFLRKKVERSTLVTTNEVRQRSRFGAVSAAVAARSKDLSKMSADQMAFAAQKDQPNGKKTMLSFLWKLELEAYDAEHNG
jgi:hypothetical protein